MKKPRKKDVFSKNQIIGGKNGPCQPPKKRTVIIAEIKIIPRYSPMKNIPNFIPEYSV